MRVSVFDWTLLAQGAGFTLILSLGTMLISTPLAILLGVLRAIHVKKLFCPLSRRVDVIIAVMRHATHVTVDVYYLFGLPFLGSHPFQ